MARKKAPQQRQQRQRPARLYEGAKFSRLTADWLASGTSADAEVRGSLATLRNRARQLIRDSDYARQAIRAIRNNVIGTGVKMQAQVMKVRGGRLDDVANDRIEDRWAMWGRAETCHTAGRLSFQDIERLAVGSMAESGEVFIRMVPQVFGGGRVPLALEVIESDQLDETVDRMGTVDGQQFTGGEWRMGIHVDDWGRPIEYAFLTRHPGDDRTGYAKRRHMVVPAAQVLHLMVAERPNQTRAVTWLASAIKQLHHLAGYQEAEVVRARAASSLMGFITTQEGAGEELGEDLVDGQHVAQFEPGTIKTLFAGQDITVPDLHAPDGQFEPFVRALLRAMAAGLGVSYETLSRDYSQSNYSSSRLSLLEDRENWRALQAYMIRSFHQPIFRAWLRAAVGSGDLALPGYELAPERYEAVRWVARGWEWVDPAKEGDAYRAAVRDGFMTQAEVVLSRGGDYAELIRQRAAELEEQKELSLMFDTNPVYVSSAGVTQARPPGSEVLTDASDSSSDPPDDPPAEPPPE